jgi:sugar phosphate isomerase/epimerase
MGGVQVPEARVTLSTASTYPEGVGSAFDIAARLGYDGVELMVMNDPISQDVEAVRRLSDHHGMPVVSVHAPCLLITQRVWGADPWGKLEKAKDAAERLGADVVVVHPPFRWQRDYARGFVDGIARMENETAVRFAVENMYPWRAATRELAAYAPAWDPTDEDFAHLTLDLSHTAVSGSDAIAMAAAFGDRLAHLHLADGTGSARDEHLVPGRGSQPCAQLLESLAHNGFSGHVTVEVSTRRAPTHEDREFDLAEALAFARLNLASPVPDPRR